MKHGKFHRATTFVVIGMFVFALAWTEGCGGYVTRGGGSGGNSISGTVVDDQTMSAVAGAVVLLEQVDGSGIDRVILSATSGSNGTFSFNPSSSGVYDVVADSTATSATGATATYAATVTFGVPAGASLNQIPLVPEFGNTSPSGIPATIFGRVSSSGSNMSFQNKVDVQLSALQSVSPAVGSVTQLTIPAFLSSTASITTTNASCMIGTTCANYTLLVPEGNISVGMFSASGTLYTKSAQQHIQGVSYTVEGKASFPAAPLSPDCIPSSTSSAISVSSGTLGTGNPNLTFTGCS